MRHCPLRASGIAMLLAMSTAACGGPTPRPTITSSATAAAVPEARETAPGIAIPTPDVVAIGEWSATCNAVEVSDCDGIARVFINNLARNGAWVLKESGGTIAVTLRTNCPVRADSVEASCWQASAAIADGRICMLVSRQRGPDPLGVGFGQVGGDDMSGRAGGPPTGWPICA